MLLAIQGERGSNSHKAALSLHPGAEVEPGGRSEEVLEALLGGRVDAAVLPIENTLHGSVVDHYDLLLGQPIALVTELRLRVEHALLVPPGVRLMDVRRVLSHPVALSQCRRWLREHRTVEAVPFADTAGSLRYLMESGARDAAAIAPELAATVYGGEVLERGLEDHAENYTRFHTVVRREDAGRFATVAADKMSVAFRLEHRPGSLVRALAGLAGAGADLTRIESRPVAGRPWEYVFYVDLRWGTEGVAEAALEGLRGCCGEVQELGRYRAAGS